MAVREFLVTAAERQGAVLLLDDLHLADPESLILVDDVARLTRRYRLVVIVAQRSDAVTRPGFEVVKLAERRGAPVDQQRILDLPTEVTEVLRRLAVIGDRFDRLEFTAASGHDVPNADRLLELALASGVIGSESDGYRFADPATADQLAGGHRAALTTEGDERDRDASR